MFALRCTKKLLDRLPDEPEPSPAAPATVLGHWYANIVRVGRQSLVLAVSERTLLPVVMPLREAKTLPRRLAVDATDVMAAIGVPREDIDAEVAAMASCVIARTADRRVLGSLNDLAFMLEVGLRQHEQRSLLEQALWLARTPLKLIDHAGPDQATLAAFSSRKLLAAMSAGSRSRS